MEGEAVPDFVMTSATANKDAIVETIGASSSLSGDSATMGGAPMIHDENSTDVPMLDESEDPSNFRSPERFLQDVIIARAPEEVRSRYRPANPATPEQIEEYRQNVLNHPTTKHRLVFQQWPRDPKGAVITPENSAVAKVAGNGQQIWGETLFDFFSTCRVPGVTSLATFTSGSKMARWVTEHKETFAQDLVEQQESEAEPTTVKPYDIGKLIQKNETMHINAKWSLQKSWSKDPEKNRYELPQPWPPASPFDPSAYPSPWPIPPFTQQHMTRIPTLQQYIPQCLLPETLVVHDPWKLLAAERVVVDRDSEEFRTEKLVKWNEKEDITHIYRLQHSEINSIRRMKDMEKLESEYEERCRVYDKFLADPHSRNKLPDGFMINEAQDTSVDEPGPIKPPIYVVFPLRPIREQPEEAHLYIAPAGTIGEGNHSFVYKTELELPRNFLVNDDICQECVLEDLESILREQDGPNGERRDPKWNEKSGRLVLKTTEVLPAVAKMEDPIDGTMAPYIIKPGKYEEHLEYEGPFRVVESRVQFPDLSKGPYCVHIREEDRAIHPLTSKVYVAAKLSKQGDAHLAAESENYQKFPRHFFEHWTGYNILRPMHDPVPVNALVPQFYGYYAVETKSTKLSEPEGEDKGEGTPYLSPLLLLEDCGHPIVPERLSIDDINQSGSLIYRFHEEGWLHGSVARRNILRQPGPLTASPSERAANAAKRGGLGEQWSFRLIDFGRSTLSNIEDDHLTTPQILERGQITAWIGGWGTEEVGNI